jgi:hypothetical protein
MVTLMHLNRDHSPSRHKNKIYSVLSVLNHVGNFSAVLCVSYAQNETRTKILIDLNREI